jgi:Mu-like prophage major head subunit gpT
MPQAVTPQYIMDLESRMRLIQVNDYARLSSSDLLWWDKVTKTIPSASRREIISWILSTALIEDQGEGGQLAYDTMFVQETEYVNTTAGKGLKLRRQQFEDLDGNGVALATKWVQDVTANAAYWPQQKINALLAAGETTTAYDKVNYFSNAHPSNPFDTGAGFYANLFTGTAGAAGANANDLNKLIFPGAVDVDTKRVSTPVTPDAALAALIRAFIYIWRAYMPNGVLPRMLTPRFLLAPPQLYPSLVQITQAKFLAQAVGSAGGTGDVEKLIGSMGFGAPVLGRDLVDQTSFYIFCEDMTSDQLGAFGYLNREPFSVRYYTGRGGGTGTDAVLDIKDELEWHTSGRNVAVTGHPWLCYKCKAT